MSFFGDLGGSISSDLAGMAFNAWQADKQMDFQAKMASTQYQRAANDLQAAGLNRVLALGSPAASPGGSAASFSPNDWGQTSIGSQNAATNAANARTAAAVGDAQRTLMGEQGEAAKAAASASRSQAALNGALADKTAFDSAKAFQEARESQSRSNLNDWNAKLLELEFKKQSATKALYDAGSPVIEGAVNAGRSAARGVSDFLGDMWNAVSGSASVEGLKSGAWKSYVEKFDDAGSKSRQRGASSRW